MEGKPPLTGRNRSVFVFHAVYWSTAYVFWLAMTTANHPTWPLRILCTGILVADCALYSLYFAPRAKTVKSIAQSVATLFVCGTAGALLIHVVYDCLLGPDPRRFTLVSNVVLDTAFVFVNTIAAAGLAALLSRATGFRFWNIDRHGP